ncbi:MAG: glycoside hydrolase family 3 C-terminal domain-containing protein [Acidobacteriaceae bacterium]|nr:glycoside hydrolase family 3 C-terminal domain-containing protein [Acidobacteriaceae bacterium]
MHSCRWLSRYLLILLFPVAVAQAQSSTLAAPSAAEIDARVESLLAKLPLEKKLEMLGGHNGFFIHDEPSIGLPPLRMVDGPVGVRNLGASTAYPAGIALAATFDADLAFQEGVAIGRDARSRGAHFLLGPGVNLYRAPMNGRNFEYFGEDPFLASRMTVNYIEGIQKQGVSATVKHFALNNEEYDRHHLDSIVDERTLRELYLPAFEAAVREAHTGAIMNSYNLINGVHASQNQTLNIQIAKQDWGFPGVIMSDWNSVYDGVAAANGGLDLEMPSAKFMTAQTLSAALKSGALTQATIDDKVRRMLRLAVRMGWLDHPQTLDTPKDDPASRAVARKVALESITLLKNADDFLPLDAKSICTLAVIGPNADKPVVGGGGSAQVTPVSALSTLDALRAALPATAKCPGVVYSRGLPPVEEIFRTTSFDHGIAEQLFTTPLPSTKPDSTHNRDHLTPAADPSKTPSAAHSGLWVADYTPQTAGPVLIFVATGTQDSVILTVDGKQVLSILKPEGHPIISTVVPGDPSHPLHLELSAHFSKNPESIGLGLRPVATLVSDEAKALAAKADAVLIAAGYDAHTEGEGFDRSFTLPGGQSELIQAIAAVNPHTIVAVDAGGGFEMTPWIDHVPAVFHLWYPGEEGAPALASMLFGSANPEGHLPISIERSFADNPAHNSYFPNADSTPEHPQIKLTEGVFLGYRYYAGSQIKPLFPFGYGLSYTSFGFSHLNVENTPQGVVVSFDVKNTGTRAGGDAVQVYVSDPSATVKRPVEELKAFRKVHLAPKEAAHLEFTLDRRAFAYWSESAHRWQVDPGKFTILAGDASDHLPLSADLTLAANANPSPAAPAAPAPAPAKASASFYNGTKEYSISIEATKVDHADGKESWSSPQAHSTRVIEQLEGFVSKAIPTDKWGGRTDISATATGYFYTKKIGDRWWAIDPEGHAYFHMAVVNLGPSGSPNAKAALARTYGTSETWMTKTHAMLLQRGFNGAGAWSNLDLIRNSSLQSTHPIAYTLNLDFMASYGKQRGGLHSVPGHAGYLNDVIFTFDPKFPEFVDHAAKALAQYANDPALFGYFSDNEMPLNRSNLDGYLSLPHTEPGYLAAQAWMDEHHASHPNDDLRKQFLAYETDRYYSIVSAAIHKYDPHHMYIGSRITGKSKECPEVLQSLGKYADAISINYYNSWTPDDKLMAMWERESGKPEIITEWYVKGADSGMPNKTGAGWLVATQAQRGAFYQNYALKLIESKSIVGWHWFKYQDNDPNDPHAELSNRDANKGIVNINYQQYLPLIERMGQLNSNAYALADYFDTRAK